MPRAPLAPGKAAVDESQIKPFFRAIATGNLSKVQQLISQNSLSASSVNSRHQSALSIACAYGQAEIAEFLLERNANVDGRDQVARKGQRSDTSEPHVALNPLHVASSNGHLVIVKLLLLHGADPNFVDHAGHTAATLAASAPQSPPDGEPYSDARHNADTKLTAMRKACLDALSSAVSA